MRSHVVVVALASAIGIAYGASLNVLDFGAKGDGVSDDTAAFNAAGAAMLKQAMSGATIWGFRNRGERSGSVEEPRPALFVPKGRYLIKGTIVMSRDVYVRGEDGTELVGESPTNDIFYVAAAYRTRIENLSFVGGRHQFRPETFNTESANIRILNCRFRDSAAAAVHSLSYKVKGERWGCGAWKYDRKTFEFSPNTNYVPEKLVANNHSTMFVIDGCRFDRCATAVRMCPDGSVVRNSEFIMAPGETNAALRVSNEMHGYNLKFSHYAGSAAIETAGSLKLWLENSSVTTPDRSGARVLRGNLCSSGSVASELVIQDVRTDAGLAQGAAICDFRDAFPAYAALVRVTAEGPNEVKAFSFKPQEDFAAFDKSRRIKAWEPDRFFSYGLRDCSANIVWRDGYAKRFERPIPDWAAGKIVGCSVDHSTAGEKKVFEPKWHEIGDIFVVDRDMTFDADGVAAFRGMPADKPWFVVKKGARAVLRNLQMRGGRNFVVVEPGGEAFVDSCFSYDCEEAAFKCEKGGRLEVDCGVYYAARLYEGEGDAALRSIWYRYTGVVPPDAPIPPFAAIVNRGKLVAQDVLGVPTVFDRFPHDVSQAMAEPTTRYDLRWVDNYGDYSSRMFRYGGEWGGVPAVFHFGAAKTLVEGGYAWYWNRSVADAMVVSDSPNGDIKVFGVVFAQYRQYLKRIELHWRDSSGSDHPIANPQMHFTCPTPEPRPATSEPLEGSKPDYVVYRPLQPRGGKNADPTKRGDCYNDHFQVIWDDARKLYYAFWTQGSGEGYGDMHVCLSKSADRGRTWTYPKLIAGGEKIAESKPRAVWQQPMLSKSGRLYCLWNQQVNDEKLHHGVVYGAYSDDAGETWSKPEQNNSIPRQFRDDWKGVSLPNWCNWQRPLRLAEGGKFLVACTRHGTGRGEPHRSLAIEFWRFENVDEDPEIRDIKITVLSGGKDAIRVPAGDTGRFICEEAGIVKLPDGRLFALMRTRNRHPYWVQSSDGGVSWSKPEPLRDAKGEAYLHPCSPCPIYDVNGCEAASGEYVAFIHNAYDDSIPPLGRQPRGPVYMIRGRFDPKSAQPIVFGTPELFSPVKNGNSYYASFTCADGEGVLWFAHQKHFLIGRKIDSVGKGALPR